MAPLVPISAEDLSKVIDDFLAQVKELEKAPAKLNDKVDELKWFDTAIYLAITGIRDEIQDHFSELLSMLAQAVQGAFAPVYFIDYAAKWQKLSGSIALVNSYHNDPKLSMEGHWDGGAYKAFKGAQGYQDKAMTKLCEMCDKTNAELLTLAAEGRDFYRQVADKLITLIAQFTVAIVESVTAVGLAWSVNTFNDAIVTQIEIIGQTFTKFFEGQCKTAISKNALIALINNPPGFYLNSEGKLGWPSVQDDFDHKDDEWKMDGED